MAGDCQSSERPVAEPVGSAFWAGSDGPLSTSDSSSRPESVRRLAVVIGAGVAGLTAARALADSFEEVVVLERDILPTAAKDRPGTPQSRHVHVMLAGGMRALNDLLPGFESALLAAGAKRLTDAGVRWELPGYDPFPSRDFGLRACSMSRALLEFTLRKEVLRHSAISLRDGCRVVRLVPGPDQFSVQGIQYETPAGSIETVATELVVDASGQGLPTLHHLDVSGVGRPTETVIGIDMGYGTAALEIPEGALGEIDAVVHMPDPPLSTRRGLLVPIEGDRWMVTLVGRHADKPPGNWEDFLEFAQGFRSPTIRRVIGRARDVGRIARYRFPASVRRHFDRLPRFPRGLLPLGDVICRFNPVWGQGMTVAAQQACLLRSVLRNRASTPDALAGLAGAYFSAVAPVVDAPWQIAAVPDLEYFETEGERPPDLERTLRFGTALRRVASVDPEIHRLMLEVQQLLRPAAALNDPDVFERIMAPA